MLNTFIKLLVLVFSACVFNTQAAIGVASVHHYADIEVVQRQSSVGLDKLVRVSAVLSFQQHKVNSAIATNQLIVEPHHLESLTRFQILQKIAFSQQKNNCLKYCTPTFLSIYKTNPPTKESPIK